MGFPKDRTGWKKPGPRITAQRYDEIIAAIRAEPNALESIARRFDVGTEVIRRLAPKAGVAPSMINEGGVVTPHFGPDPAFVGLRPIEPASQSRPVGFNPGQEAGL